jgi:hypothetical protein
MNLNLLIENNKKIIQSMRIKKVKQLVKKLECLGNRLILILKARKRKI